MKSENGKLLLGLGIGILVGGAIGLYLAADKEQLKEDLGNMVDGVKDGAKNVYGKVKKNVNDIRSTIIDEAEEMEEDARRTVRNQQK